MFLLSCFSILFSSYFITSICMKNNERNNLGIIYFLLIAFSLIILQFELLSLFGLISEKNFLISNFIFLAGGCFSWSKTGKPLYCISPKEDLRKIVNSLKTDKTLIFLTVCFFIFLISELFVALVFPVVFGDALAYTFPRCTTWISNGSLNHFLTPDTREVIMPINMELLYTWLFLFLKKENGSAVFSFIGFLSVIYIMYNFAGELKYSIKRRLWAIYVFSSLALIGVMAYTPCSDLFLGALLLSSVYLFFVSCRHDNKISLYFSALSFALAVGVKTTAFMMLPSICVVDFVILQAFAKSRIKSVIGYYLLFFLINFTVFSSYNFILNFIQFSNPISNTEQLLIHKFSGGVKGFLCNLIKYCFVICDVSGIRFLEFWNVFVTNMQERVLALIGETPQSYMSAYFSENFKYNSSMTVATSGFGVLGLIALLPSLFCAVKNTKKSKKTLILSAFAVSLFINIVVISKAMLFASFNIRYLTAFVVLASLCLLYSYKHGKSFYKFLLCFFMFVYLVAIVHVKPVSFILKYISLPQSADKYEKVINVDRAEKRIYKYFTNRKKLHLGLIANSSESALFDIEKLKLEGFKIDKLLPENIEVYDLSKYDYLITSDYKSVSTDIKKYAFDKSAFISPCLYRDTAGEIINDDENKIPASVECLIPVDYIIKNGFEKINDINIDKYFIFKKITG